MHFKALSTRNRFRLKAQLFLFVFNKIHVHTRTGKRRFRKVPLWRPSSKISVFGDRFIVYLWPEGPIRKKEINLDTCGRGPRKQVRQHAH